MKRKRILGWFRNGILLYNDEGEKWTKVDRITARNDSFSTCDEVDVRGEYSTDGVPRVTSFLKTQQFHAKNISYSYYLPYSYPHLLLPHGSRDAAKKNHLEDKISHDLKRTNFPVSPQRSNPRRRAHTHKHTHTVTVPRRTESTPGPVPEEVVRRKVSRTISNIGPVSGVSPPLWRGRSRCGRRAVN